ncbi:uncharacterized protein LOC129908505 [Episyrphus balteatus]|uniref:uncharacterized protein LOC129908505 n=1 Tax=Episyrphus balteatus TaxID=286459 RepID=UPI002484F8DB|nr:uncharacterized protein LOC129908505 [Episyrphus balteatus]
MTLTGENDGKSGPTVILNPVDNQNPIVNQNPTGNQMAISGLSVAARMPQFWRDRPSLWFAQLETILSASRPNDDTKFQYVIANLDRRDLEQISDILLTPPAANKYAKVKERLIKVYEENEEQRMQRLIEGLDLGDSQPSQLLRRIRDLSGSSGTPDTVIKVMWLSRLPSHVRAILSSVTAELNSLAEVADKIMSHSSSPKSIAALPPPASPASRASGSDNMKGILQRLSSIEKQLNQQTKATQQSSSSSRQKTEGRRRTTTDGHCWLSKFYY